MTIQFCRCAQLRQASENPLDTRRSERVEMGKLNAKMNRLMPVISNRNRGNYLLANASAFAVWVFRAPVAIRDNWL